MSYAPSATVFKYLREQPRPDRHAGLLALGDPVYERPGHVERARAVPDHGLLVNVVATRLQRRDAWPEAGRRPAGLQRIALHKHEDLRLVADAGTSPYRSSLADGRVVPRDLASGKLGVVLDPRPAPEAIAANERIAACSWRRGRAPRYFAPCLARDTRSRRRPALPVRSTGRPAPARGRRQRAQLDRLAASGELGRFGFIHLATHGVIDEGVPARSAVILTQAGLPDPLEQALKNKPVFDGRLSVREIQHGWELNAELVTLSACETALGREAGGEGFVGFTQAL